MLSTLLFGEPLGTRGGLSVEALGAELDRALRGVVDAAGARDGALGRAHQAALEWGRILQSPRDYPGIAARRAALLFALHTLPAVRRHYAQAEPELVADLERRVLPAVVPAFLAGMAQRPEALVVLTSTLSTMWREPHGRGRRRARGAAAAAGGAGATGGGAGGQGRTCVKPVWSWTMRGDGEGRGAAAARVARRRRRGRCSSRARARCRGWRRRPRLIIAWMSLALKAFSEPSAEMPSDSRKLCVIACR